MGLFSKPVKWIKRQTHGGLKKGLSARGLKSTIKGTIRNPIVQAGAGIALGSVAAPFIARKIGGLLGGGSSDVGSLVENAGDIAGSQSRFRKIAGGVGEFIGGKDGFGMDDVLSLGKAAGQAYGAYDSGKRLNRLEDIATDEYNQGAPLRAQARQMLMDDSRPDLSSVFVDPNVPRYRRINIGSSL